MTESRQWFYLAIVTIVTVLLYLVAPVLSPFIVSLTLAYMGDPVVDRLEKHIPRAAAVSVVFFLIFILVWILLLVLIPSIERQLVIFFQKLPIYLDRIEKGVFPWVQARFNIADVGLDMDLLKSSIQQHWAQAGNIVAKSLSTITQSGMALVGWIANLILIPVLTFYLLRDWDILVARIHELLPRHIEATVAKLASDSDEVLGAFLRGQLSVMASLGIIYSIGLGMVGMDFWLLIGMLAGLVSFVPYLGFVVGILVAGAAAMLQFQDVMMLLPVVAVFGVGQLAESFLLTPLLVGDKIGLHPVAVIFAVLAGGQLFGFFGILLALPVAAVVMVVLRHAHEHYKNSHLYDERGG